MYTLNILKDSTAVMYEKMTFPAFQYVLQEINSKESLIAIAASYQEEPVGLVLAEIRTYNQSAEVLSLFVEPSHRCAGIGTNLLNRLETELTYRRCKKVELVYMTGKSTTPALENLLHKCGWTSPQPRMLVCKGEMEKGIQAPWLKQYSQLPAAYTIFPWREITTQERQAIERQQATQPWIPEDLIPFKYDKQIEPLNSLGLRYQGQVVGWLISHRIFPDTIRYTCAFCRPDIQKKGRMITLFYEAAKLQLNAKIPHFIWTTPMNHQSMVAFVKYRCLPYLTSIQETRIISKLLLG